MVMFIKRFTGWIIGLYSPIQPLMLSKRFGVSSAIVIEKATHFYAAGREKQIVSANVIANKRSMA